MITAPEYLCIAALCGIFLIGGFIYLVIQDKRHPETRMCPSCGHVLQYKNTVNIPDPNCSICHGTGQGNGGYTGDSGECECGIKVEVCPYCGKEL